LRQHIFCLWYSYVEKHVEKKWQLKIGVKKVVMYNHICGKEYTVPRKKIYTACPHIVANNHFSGENVMEYIGKNELTGLKEF
jgi:hypothetical protein